MTIPHPGHGFRPTDVEVTSCLEDKVAGKNHDEHIQEMNAYLCDPENIPNIYPSKKESEASYYFCRHHQKSTKDSRIKRSNEFGFWKITGKVADVYDRNVKTGKKTYLVFYRGTEKTDWIMHEYRLVNHVPGDYVVCKILKKSNSSRKQNGKPKEGSVIANIFDHQNHDLLSQFGNKESTSSDEMALEDDSPSVFRNDTAKVPPQHVEEKNYTSIGIDINSDIIRASGRGNPNLSPQSGNNESTSTNEMALNDNSHSEIRNDTTEVLPQHVEDNGMDISPDKVYQHGASGPGNPNLLLQFGNNGSTSSDEMPLDDNSPSEIHNDTTKVLPQNVEEITDNQMDISPDFFFQHGVSALGIPNLLQQYGNNENTNSDAMTLDDNRPSETHNDMTEVLPHFRTLSGAQESSTEGASLADVSEIIEGLQPDELCPIDSNCFFGPRELGFDDGTNSMGYLF